MGAIDGKNVAIKAPPHSGTLYHYHKGFSSVVLMAICDANYCFSFVDVGNYGSNNDSGVLLNFDLGKKFKSSSMNIPEPSTKAGYNNENLPYFLVGDEIFPLQEWLMRPFSRAALTSEVREIFHYRHSRARRVIENAFGILVSGWRIFRQPIEASPQKVKKYTLAAIALHNYLCQTDTAFYNPTGFLASLDSTGNIKEGSWRINAENEGESTGINNILRIHNSRSKQSAIEMRDKLYEYIRCLLKGK